MPEVKPIYRGSDGAVYLRALAVAALGLLGVAMLVGTSRGPRAKQLLGIFKTPKFAVANFKGPEFYSLRTFAAAPLTRALRKKGYHECNPHDPIGLGPYAPYRKLSMGRIALPQRGGHTDDMGFDVVVHFHGYSATRKTFVQVARGSAYVGIDRGLGSGPYAEAFRKPSQFAELTRSIAAALRKHTHDEGAYVRHLALSAWSAGYGAINQILKQDDSRIDAVILLDGLHAAWNPASAKRDGSLASVSGHSIEPIIDFARKAAKGEKFFYLTHSQIDPKKYPSTSASARLLLHELGLTAKPQTSSSAEIYGVQAVAKRQGFFLASYAGRNEAAHCTHISHIADALQRLEQRWQTPALDRSVPFTKAPKLGDGNKKESLVAPAPNANNSAPVLGPAEPTANPRHQDPKVDPLEADL